MQQWFKRKTTDDPNAVLQTDTEKITKTPLVPERRNPQSSPRALYGDEDEIAELEVSSRGAALLHVRMRLIAPADSTTGRMVMTRKARMPQIKAMTTQNVK